MKKDNNIFLCIPTLRNAGAERFVTELACSISKEKYRVFVVVTGVFEKDTAFYKKLVDEKITVLDATATNYLMQVLVLRKLFKTYHPVIVHSNVSSVLHVLIPTLLFAGKKTKHLFTTHSMGYRLFYGLKKKIMKLCFRKGIVIPVAICDTVKQSIVDAYQLDTSKIECIYNGVDTDSFYKQSYERDDNFSFVCVGTLYHIKNHDLLIDAFRIVKEMHQCSRLVLVGDGELKDALKAKVEDYNLSDSVEFVGNQPNVRLFLSRADAYCCSSKVEGLPISVLEAMSCSLPVVTTPAGGVVDIVKNGLNGFIVEPDAVKYAEKMLELIDNPQLRTSMADESRRTAQEFSLKQCAKSYEDLYEKYSK